MKNIIEKTASSFEKSFSEDAYYNLQTQDKNHLSLIIESLDLTPGKQILDLGTGSGYLAFHLAETNPQCHIVGLDIVQNTISRNASIAKENRLKNIDFLIYDGINFPFEKDIFDIIVSRYAFHHFPLIEKSFNEIARVLREKGQLFISDPTPNKVDQNHFIDKYMQMKDDGHQKFYTLDEFSELGKFKNLILVSNDMTKIRFPRKDAQQYLKLLNTTKDHILDAYQVEIIDDEIYITEDVLNISFMKV